MAFQFVLFANIRNMRWTMAPLRFCPIATPLKTMHRQQVEIGATVVRCVGPGDLANACPVGTGPRAQPQIRSCEVENWRFRSADKGVNCVDLI